MPPKNIPYNILNIALNTSSIHRLIKNCNTHHSSIQISNLVDEEVRSIVKVKLEEIMYKIHLIVEYHDKKKISINDALSIMDNKMFWNDKNLQKCIRDKKSNCLYFSKNLFKDLIRLVLRDIKQDYPMRAGVSLVIQYYIEDYIQKIIEKTILVALNGKRITIYPRDFQIVLDNEEI